MNMPSLQNRSNCAFRCGFPRLATIPTAKSGLEYKKPNEAMKLHEKTIQVDVDFYHIISLIVK
jgi:hypothetical protein